MALLIDPAEKQVFSVAVNDPDLEPLKTSDPVYLNGSGDVIYESAEGDNYTVLEGVRRPLRGKLLVVGTTEDGEDCDPKVSLQEILEEIDFGTASNGMYYGEKIVRAIQR